MKKIIVLLSAVIALFCFGINVSAEAEHPERLIDNAGLLSETEFNKLSERLDNVSEKYNYDVVILTENRFNGAPEYYSESYFINNGYGMGDDKDGIVLFISMAGGVGNRDLCVKPIYKEMPYNDILDDIYDDFAEGNYYDGMQKFIGCVEDEFEFPWLVNIAIALVVGIVVGLIVVSVMKGKLKTVHYQNNAKNYVRDGSFVLDKSRDLYLYSTVTRVAKPKNNSNGSRGGMSRGGTASGGSRKF